MDHSSFTAKSLRPFLGSKKFKESREFYSLLDWEELVIDQKMSFFKINENIGFYLQDYYVKRWIDNTMVFLEVDDLDRYYDEIREKDLDSKYKYVRFTDIKDLDWGREFFMHDPCGILWHFGNFKS